MHVLSSELSPKASLHDFETSSKILNWRASYLLLIAFGAIGCASGSMQRMTSESPQILTQPSSISVPVAQTGTFSVVATGTAPLTYQWSENGTPTPNSNGATFTTAAVAPVDSGSKFSVTVTNSAGSVVSNAVTLTVGPRTPKSGDLRFQQVSAPSTINGLSPGGIHFNVSAGLSVIIGNSIGSPLSIGGDCGPTPNLNPLACGWVFSSFPLPAGVSGLNTSYLSTNNYDNLDSDFASLTSPDTVITSFDLRPGFNTYAISSIQTSQPGGFDLARQTVLPASLPLAAAQAGAQSRVITAISFDASGQVNFLSYGWQGDITTLYEVNVFSTTFDNIATAATTLAADGYILTAIGGNFTDGFILIGTRVQGDILPRPILIVPDSDAHQFRQLIEQGYAIVGYLFSADASNNFWIGER